MFKKKKRALAVLYSQCYVSSQCAGDVTREKMARKKKATGRFGLRFMGPNSRHFRRSKNKIMRFLSFRYKRRGMRFLSVVKELGVASRVSARFTLGLLRREVAERVLVISVLPKRRERGRERDMPRHACLVRRARGRLVLLWRAKGHDTPFVSPIKLGEHTWARQAPVLKISKSSPYPASVRRPGLASRLRQSA